MAARANHGRRSGRVIALSGGNYDCTVSPSRARGAASSPFLHNADAYRLSPSAYSPTANLCSNCRACHAAASALRFGQSHRTQWPHTLLSRPQAPMHGEIGAHRLHFVPKACRSTASEPVGLSVRGGTAQQVDGYSPQHASTPFGFGVAATASPTLKSRYAFNATFARTPISPCIAITSAKAERAVAHTHTKSAKRLCDAYGESSPHNGGRGERHGGGIFRDARQQGKGSLSAGRWGVFTDSS